MKYLFLVICFLTLHVSAQVKPVSKQKTKSKPVAPTEEFVEGGNRKALFVGGEEAMEKYILNNLKYPAQLDQDTSIKTKSVFLKFMIDKNGKVSNAHVVKGIKGCKVCTDEALRVINEMPIWMPAIAENKKVDSWHSLPLTFIKK